jgi:hypothetical protein
VAEARVSQVQGQPGLYSEILSQNKKINKQQEKTEHLSVAASKIIT